MRRQNDTEDVSEGIIDDVEVYIAFVVHVVGSTRLSSAFPVRRCASVGKGSRVAPFPHPVELCLDDIKDRDAD